MQQFDEASALGREAETPPNDDDTEDRALTEKERRKHQAFCLGRYKIVSRKGEGTFSEVLEARDVRTGRHVALKCMKHRFENAHAADKLREVEALRRVSQHPNVIQLQEVLFGKKTGRLALVLELMDRNVYEVIKGRREYLPAQTVKNFMWQLLHALSHMHQQGIFHRDIKPENILVRRNGPDYVLKIADFGSCRSVSAVPPFTEYISTRWYRSPECLLTDGFYGQEMDVWAVGCVMFELSSLCPLFPGQTELDQLHCIHNVLGTPTPGTLASMKQHLRARGKGGVVRHSFDEVKGCGIAELIPHASSDCIDLITRLLAYDPSQRLSAAQALQHSYFDDVREQQPVLRSVSRTQSRVHGRSRATSRKTHHAAGYISRRGSHELQQSRSFHNFGSASDIHGQSKTSRTKKQAPRDRSLSNLSEEPVADNGGSRLKKDSAPRKRAKARVRRHSSPRASGGPQETYQEHSSNGHNAPHTSRRTELLPVLARAELVDSPGSSPGDVDDALTGRQASSVVGHYTIHDPYGHEPEAPVARGKTNRLKTYSSTGNSSAAGSGSPHLGPWASVQQQYQEQLQLEKKKRIRASHKALAVPSNSPSFQSVKGHVLLPTLNSKPDDEANTSHRQMHRNSLGSIPGRSLQALTLAHNQHHQQQQQQQAYGLSGYAP